MRYYILMIDYGRKGLEANVHPEDTRSDIIERAAEAISDGLEIDHIHVFDDGVTENVTDEIMEEVEDFLQRKSERSYERYLSRFNENTSLHQQQIEARRFK